MAARGREFPLGELEVTPDRLREAVEEYGIASYEAGRLRGEPAVPTIRRQAAIAAREAAWRKLQELL